MRITDGEVCEFLIKTQPLVEVLRYAAAAAQSRELEESMNSIVEFLPTEFSALEQP